MPGHQFERLTEGDERLVERAEADLGDLLSVEPSAELAAKVRMRIDAGQPGRRQGLAGWRLALGVVSIAVVGTIGILVIGNGVDRTVRPSPAELAAPPAQVLRTPAPAPRGNPSMPAPPGKRMASAAPRRDDAGKAGEGRPVRRAHGRTEPEVLVPPDRRLAIERALELSRNGELDPRLFAGTLVPAVQQTAPGVTPIVVERIAVPAVDLGGGAGEQGVPEN
jgi:hypothetical protein